MNDRQACRDRVAGSHAVSAACCCSLRWCSNRVAAVCASCSVSPRPALLPGSAPPPPFALTRSNAATHFLPCRSTYMRWRAAATLSCPRSCMMWRCPTLRMPQPMRGRSSWSVRWAHSQPLRALRHRAPPARWAGLWIVAYFGLCVESRGEWWSCDCWSWHATHPLICIFSVTLQEGDSGLRQLAERRAIDERNRRQVRPEQAAGVFCAAAGEL